METLLPDDRDLKDDASGRGLSNRLRGRHISSGHKYPINALFGRPGPGTFPGPEYACHDTEPVFFNADRSTLHCPK
jgi:hypothetical protein